MKNIMVCVTKQKTCERLISYGEQLKSSDEDSLLIIHVSKSDEKFLGNSKESDALKYLYNIAMERGANLIVLKSDNVKDTLARQVEENNIHKIIVGASDKKQIEGNFIKELKDNLAEEVELIVVPA
ncbi:MAG: universal stress protein UspA [Clostridiales bacterium]|jgi:K+-sensing histidine kinase KdpD|nr:universal stress protein UspA [Clostridiales bacterium]